MISDDLLVNIMVNVGYYLAIRHQLLCYIVILFTHYGQYSMVVNGIHLPLPVEYIVSSTLYDQIIILLYWISILLL